MMRKSLSLLAVAGLVGMLYGGSALAGHDYRYGMSHPGKGYGHFKHKGHGHWKHGYQGHYRHGHRGHHFKPPHVVHYSRHVTHVHGPHCAHGTRTYYRGHSPYYHRDYGRASFRGYDSGVRYRIEFDY